MDLRWLPTHFFRNLGSLYGAQATSYLLPLITIPYIVRTIGPERYGLIALATAVVQYAVIVTEYGYNFTAPRDVARKRDDRIELNRYVNAVFWTRLLLAGISFIIGSTLLIVLPLLPELKILVLLTCGVIVGKVLFLQPVFYGLEQAKSIARFTIAAAILGVVLIFALIRQSSDYFFIPLIYSASSIAIGCVSMFWSLRRMNIRIRKPDVHDVRTELRSGFRVFLSTGMISLYVVSNTLILGIFAPSIVVGWYSAGEKLVRAVQGAFAPFQNLLFPSISREVSHGRRHALRSLKKSATLIAPVGLSVSLLIVLLADPIATLLFGAHFTGTADVLRILGGIPFIMSLTLLFSDIFLIGFGYERYWSTLIMWAGVISIMLSLLLVALLDLRHIGSSFALLITELFVLCGALWKYRMETHSGLRIEGEES